MSAANIIWRQFPDYAVSTSTQHLSTSMIRWIRASKSGQMLFVRDKNVDPETKDPEPEEEERGPTTGEAATSNPSSKAGGDSAQVVPITSKFLADKCIGAPSM
eukprot:10131053-Karenia_brevis.AAC.1